MGYTKKQLPAIPKPAVSRSYDEPTSPVVGIGRVRAMTSSSYASTAKPPTLDADLNFGSTGFDDMFSGIDRRDSPDYTHDSPGRSLLAGKRTFQAEPIKIDRKLEVEAPLKSWDSRGSADNLMSSPRSPDNDSPPPPPPPHKYSQYAPVASHSPELNGSNDFEDTDAKVVRQSAVHRKPIRDSSPEHQPISMASSSVTSLQTPLSSRSTSNNTTPKAALRPAVSPLSEHDDDNLFAPSKPKETPVQKPAAPRRKENSPPPPASGEFSRRVMTQAEFRAQQQRQNAQPPEDSSEDEDYEDEEEAAERAHQEAMERRRKLQMDIARDSMRRTTTAPANPNANHPDSLTEPFSMGFPSETSLKADEWEDEDIPLGILAQHGFPSTARNRAPTQPANVMPSYFRSSTPNALPERPASVGAMSSRASQAFKPPFARNLPDDPHTSFIGGGIVRPTNRESMGFNRGPASVMGDMPMTYPEPQLSAPSLVDQIQMQEMQRPKYMGGASNKQRPQQGPFTGLLGTQMNGPNPGLSQTRMSQMPMAGMNGMAPVMNMMGGPMGMPMMGVNNMAYPMTQQQQSELMQMQQMQQMQQMIAQQQLQLQQMQAMRQGQDPRMSMAFQNPGLAPGNFGNGFLNAPSVMGNQRPMSVMSSSMNQPPRPYSTPSQVGGGFLSAPAPQNGYTPSIAPSERSNIGLSARYRPVATGQHAHDATSTVSSMTLQASGGANQPKTVKGILKKSSPQPQETDDDDGWAKIAASRKSKFNSSPRRDDGGASLRELVQGVDRL